MPAEGAGLGRNDIRDPFLHDGELGPAGDLLQGDCHLHLARQVRVVELVRVANPLVGDQFEKAPAEGMAVAGGEIRERHPVGSADFGVQVVNLPREPIGWQPLDHRLNIEKRPVNPLGIRPQHTMKSDGTGHELLLGDESKTRPHSIHGLQGRQFVMAGPERFAFVFRLR